MQGLFVALGIAILTLLAILLWFVPYLLQQHAVRVARESNQLRDLITDMMNEQEAVAMRQVQLGTSISYLQDQLEQVVSIVHAFESQQPHMLTTLENDALQALEARMSGLQLQIDRHIGTSRTRSKHEHESWVHLLSLLHAMQDRLRIISEEHTHIGIAAKTG